MQHYTTIEQSKKLLELGLNPDTADMSYTWNFDDSRYEITTTPIKNWIVPKYAESTKIQQVLPCWSLGALLDVMPDGVQINFNHTGVIIDITFVHNGIVTNSHHVKNNTLLEAAYSMVVWLLENGYIKKGE